MRIGKLDYDLENGKFYALSFIILISILVYLPVFKNSLLNWDDAGYITYNALIQSFNLKGIFSEYVMGNWHPITLLFLAVEYQFFGLNPSGYHAVNLLLHLLNVILVFHIVYHLSSKAGVGLVASLLFGIHPLHVESVAWAAELKDLLFTLFFLSSYLFYLKYIREGQKKNYWLSLLLFLFSLLSKAMAVSLPLVLILTDFFKNRRINLKSLIEKVPFFVLALIAGIVAIRAQESGMEHFFQLRNLVFASYGFISYLIKLVFPNHLSAFYSYPLGDIPISFYLYILLLTGLALLVIYSFRYTKKIFFAIGFFTLTIFLVLQILPVGDAIMADRYSYIPSIALFYLAGEGFQMLWKQKQKLFSAVLILVIVIFLSVKTYARCEVWKDDRSLWNDVLQQNHQVEIAYFLRGVTFADEGKNQEAIADFSQAIELKPDDAVAYYNRAAALIEERRYDAALQDFNKAIELKPDCFPAYVNRAIFFGMEKKYEQAIHDLDRAIELKPDYAIAFYNRGIFYYYSGKITNACVDLKQATSLGYEPAQKVLMQISQK
jgi:tetratricopeptide (TPR) repeat protein